MHVCSIFAAPMKEQHLAMKSLKETMQARSTALGHKLQADAAVKAVRARLGQLRSSGKPEAVLQVPFPPARSFTHCRLSLSVLREPQLRPKVSGREVTRACSQSDMLHVLVCGA